MDTPLLIESIGWIASGLTVITYAMNTMLPLRVFAVLSSIFFLIYGAILGVWPLVGMEAILLPINGYRLWQLIDLRRKVRDAATDAEPDFSVVQRYGKKRVLAGGETVFQRGDAAEFLYYIAEGEVQVEPMGTTLSAGQIFGEIGFFTNASERTATVRTKGDVIIHELTQDQFLRLQFEDPQFGLSVIRTVTKRLVADAQTAVPA